MSELFFFFFSSRRRHTRSLCDWSSDVCSSDLTACLMPGRFFLGVGTGENLNEHILGDRWPSVEERQELLEEAVGLMRELWAGGLVSHDGTAYTVDRARLYTLPDEPPPVYVAAAGPESAE